MPQIFSLKMLFLYHFRTLWRAWFSTFSELKKIVMIDKEILFIARNLVNFRQKSIKARHSWQILNCWPKVRKFCSKLSCNSKTFLEQGSQDPLLIAGLPPPLLELGQKFPRLLVWKASLWLVYRFRSHQIFVLFVYTKSRNMWQYGGAFNVFIECQADCK